MRVIMTGGGTGGHIYPAIAIADKIKEQDPNAEILFVGTERGKEKELVPQSGYPIEFIRVHGLNRKNMLKNVRVVLEYAGAMRDAGKMIDRFQPDVVIGTGGYVSAPVVRAAAKRRIPTYLQEQNAIPGLTNRMLESYVDNIFLGFQEASVGFKNKEKLIFTGNPVRKDFYTNQKAECRKLLGIDEKAFMLLAFGGSQGAGRINKAMMSVIERYNGQDKVVIVFVPGAFYHLPIMTEILEKEIYLQDNIRILEYLNDMHIHLPASDLIVSRSGALTISEIAVCGKPAILIPSPIVTGDHQLFNANVLGNRGGAVVIEEKNLTDEGLIQKIETLRQNPETLAKMGEKSRDAAPSDATKIIWETIKR